MSIKPKKLLLIGVDQAIPYLLNKFLAEGILPNINKIVEKGVSGEAYSCPPCDTPTNWTTIATGAKTAVHGATSFYIHIPGEPLDHGLNIRSRGSLSKYCEAEYLWDAADKQGLTSFVFNYPGGWPGNLKNGGIGLLTWPLPETLPRELTMTTTLKYTKNGSKKALKIKSMEEKDLEIKTYLPPLQISIEIQHKNINKFPPLKAYIIAKKENEYDRLAIQNGNDSNYQILNNEEWSDWICNQVSTEYGILPCLFKARIKKLASDGSSLSLQLTSIYNTKGWTNPEEYGEKIIRNAIIYELARDQKVDYMISGKVKSFLGLARKEALTIAKTIKYMKDYINWDICFFHIHLLDSVNHSTLGHLYPESSLYTEKREKKAWDHIQTAYRIVDEMVKLLLESVVDEETIVVFLSDHGAMPSWKVINFIPSFVEANLLSYKLDDSKENYLIDWTKTKTFPYIEPMYVWVNLKGRDPHGIVDSSDYESVRDDIINTLYNLKDPDTGEKIIELAMKGGCNAVASTLGVLGSVSRKYAHKIPFIVKINHNELLTYPNTFDQIMFSGSK